MPRLALTFLPVLFLLAACSPTVLLLTREPEPTPTSTLTPVPLTATPTLRPTPIPGSKLGVGPNALRDVTVRVWHGLDGESGALLAQLAAEFSQSNVWGAQVEVVSQKNLPLLVESVEAALRSPERPDVVLALPEAAQVWDAHAQGEVVDLAPYIAHSDFGFSDAEIGDIPAAFLEQSKIGEKQLGLPAVRTGRFLFYNAGFADELGFTAPPQSAEEFRQQACAANASWKTDEDQTNDGFGGLVLENAVVDIDAPWTAYAWLQALGGDLDAGGAYTFATPENQSALDFLAQMRADGCVWLSNAASNYEALAAHRALFAAGSLQDLNSQRVAFAGSPDRWTVIAFPGAVPTIAVHGPDYVILKSSEARQLAAWLFMREMLSPVNQVRWVRENGLFPMRMSTVDLLENIRNANPQWAAAVDLLPQAKPYPQALGWPKARLLLGDGFFQLFQLNPTSNDVADILEEMDATLQDLLQ